MTGHRPLLVVVDDEQGILDVVGRFARRAGFDVVACSGGRDAVAQMQERRADLAIVDLQMPDVGGLDVLRAHPRGGRAVPDRVDDRARDGRQRHRGDQVGGDGLSEQAARLRPPRAAADGGPRRKRPARAVAARTEAARAPGVLRDDWPRPRDAGAVPPDPPPRAARAHRAHHRRDRHRQGARRARAAQDGPRRDAASSPSTAPRSWRRCSRASCSVTCAARSPARPTTSPGLFEAADGGTLFLDEIGELPLERAGEAAARARARRGPARRRARHAPRSTCT